MSSLAAALAAQKPVTKGATCSVRTLLETLNDIDRQALLNAFNSPMFSTDICRALKSEGIDLAPHVISRHRKSECNCDRG